MSAADQQTNMDFLRQEGELLPRLSDAAFGGYRALLRSTVKIPAQMAAIAGVLTATGERGDSSRRFFGQLLALNGPVSAADKDAFRDALRRTSPQAGRALVVSERAAIQLQDHAGIYDVSAIDRMSPGALRGDAIAARLAAVDAWGAARKSLDGNFRTANVQGLLRDAMQAPPLPVVQPPHAPFGMARTGTGPNAAMMPVSPEGRHFLTVRAMTGKGFGQDHLVTANSVDMAARDLERLSAHPHLTRTEAERLRGLRTAFRSGPLVTNGKVERAPMAVNADGSDNSKAFAGWVRRANAQALTTQGRAGLNAAALAGSRAKVVG